MNRRFLPCLTMLGASVALIALTGCASLAPTTLAPGAGAASAAAPGSLAIHGTAFGGFQPIAGATVSLYSAGNTGYGVGATLRATALTANDGSFSFTKILTPSDSVTPAGSSWACPITGDPLIYLVTTSGNPTGNGQAMPMNTAIGLMAPLGVCSTVSAATLVTMNEATTVASVAALQQFLNPATRNIGSSSSAMSMQALLVAAATVTNMVDFSQGIARPTQLTNSGGYNVSGVTVTVTPEISKIHTIANILASCVNSTSSSSLGCATLFTSAIPTNPTYTSQPTVTFGAATDTLMAVYYMLTNPTSGASIANDATNLNALMALQSPTSPFQPALTSTPTDWTIGIRYDAGTVGDVPNCGASTTEKFMAYTYHLAVDATGNIWAVSNTAGNGISEISPTGTPLSCALAGAAAKGFTSGTIDPAGNIWVASASLASPSDPTLYEWTPGTSTTTAWPTIAASALAANQFVMNVVSDGNNNINFAYYATLAQIPAATAIAGSPAASSNGTPISTGVKS
ncbi:MAG: hypothetical protein ABI142_11535 [Bryocella sp.]